MRALCLLALVACGSADEDISAPGDCSRLCESSRPTLVRDFGISTVNCWDPDVYFVASPAACSRTFERKWGVRLTGF